MSQKQKTEERIEKISWKKWGTRRVTLRLAEHWILCTLNTPTFFGLEFPDHLVLSKDEVAHLYLNKSQLDVFLDRFLGKLYASDFSSLYERKALPVFRNFLSFCKKIAVSPLSKLDKKQLLDLYEDFIQKEDIFTNFLWMVFIVDEFFDQELKSQLASRLREIGQGAALEKHLKIIFSAERKSAIFNQTIDILKSVKKLQDKKPRTDELKLEREVQKLAKKYGYFTIYNFDETPLTKDYFKDEIQKILKNKNLDLDAEINRVTGQFKQNKIEYQKLKKFFKAQRKLSKLIDACHKIAYLREYRNDIRRESYFYARKLYQEIARRLGMNLSDLLFLNREEVKKSLMKEAQVINKQVINRRKEYYALTLIDKKIGYIFNSKEVLRLLKVIEPRVFISTPTISWGRKKVLVEDKVFIKNFGGLIANPGKVIGKAKVVIDTRKEAIKFNRGDILVAPMTNLDFVPLISRAGAIITDEGGMTCHAAIISRELGIPCIVGTKIATKVLKDGDLVEVDAIKGIVRKVDRED